MTIDQGRKQRVVGVEVASCRGCVFKSQEAFICEQAIILAASCVDVRGS